MFFCILMWSNLVFLTKKPERSFSWVWGFYWQETKRSSESIKSDNLGLFLLNQDRLCAVWALTRLWNFRLMPACVCVCRCMQSGVCGGAAVQVWAAASGCSLTTSSPQPSLSAPLQHLFTLWVWKTLVLTFSETKKSVQPDQWVQQRV